MILAFISFICGDTRIRGYDEFKALAKVLELNSPTCGGGLHDGAIVGPGRQIHRSSDPGTAQQAQQPASRIKRQHRNQQAHPHSADRKNLAPPVNRAAGQPVSEWPSKAWMRYQPRRQFGRRP